jgi:hypothetical protein
MEGFVDIRRDLGLYDLCETITDFEDYLNIGELAYTHGWYWGVYHAAMTMREFVGNVIYGHVHHFQSDSKNKHFKKKEYIRFQNGFAVIEYRSDGTYTPHPIVIINNAFSYGGYTWKA